MVAPGQVHLSEAAALLDERDVGSELEKLLEPFADRMVISARGLFCQGSVAGVLGRPAELADDPDRAVACYRQAIENDICAGALIPSLHLSASPSRCTASGTVVVISTPQQIDDRGSRRINGAGAQISRFAGELATGLPGA